MKYDNYDQLPLTLQASDVASVLNLSRARAYTLMHEKNFPCISIGKRMIVPRDKFLEWLEQQLNSQRR